MCLVVVVFSCRHDDFCDDYDDDDDDDDDQFARDVKLVRK